MRQKILYYIRLGLALGVGILSVLALIGKSYPIAIFDVQFTALVQRVLVDDSLAVMILIAGLLLLTVLFGRIYCSILCPLGIYQEVLMLLFRRHVPVQKNKPYKYFLAALTFGALLGGTVVLIRFIDPYTLFGSVVSGTVLGLTVLGVLAILVWFKGRVFCANICPVGTMLGLIARHAVFQMHIDKDMCVMCGLCASKCPTGSIDFKNKTVDNETCIKCFRCLGGCRKGGLHYGIRKQKSVEKKQVEQKPIDQKSVEQTPFNPTRRRLLICGGTLAVLGLAVKSGIELGKVVATKVKRVIVPAGAGSAAEFANRCLNCNLCVQNCPMKILKKADANYPAVHLDYRQNFCNYECNKCSQICPSGAIKRLTLAEKQRTQIGLAHIDEQTCVKCGLCVMTCPRKAITKEGDTYPQVDINMCIGCGACQGVCPVQAITINPVEKQRML